MDVKKGDAMTNDSSVPASRPGADSLPAIMSDDELRQAIAAREQKADEPNRRKEKPDPWPIIERDFPRIAAMMRELWGTGALDDYLAKLVVDDRGGRQGFPAEVMDAILEIALRHSQQFGFTKAISPWEADTAESKRRDRG